MTLNIDISDLVLQLKMPHEDFTNDSYHLEVLYTISVQILYLSMTSKEKTNLKNAAETAPKSLGFRLV
jgi:uncharacterized secreted protein with C-terminal beta-propeller domain